MGLDVMVKDGVTRLGNKSIVLKFYDAEHWCWTHHLRILAKVIWRLIYLMFNCSIPPTAILEDGVEIAHGIGIVIHQNSVIGGVLRYIKM